MRRFFKQSLLIIFSSFILLSCIFNFKKKEEVKKISTVLLEVVDENHFVLKSTIAVVLERIKHITVIAVSNSIFEHGFGRVRVTCKEKVHDAYFIAYTSNENGFFILVIKGHQECNLLFKKPNKLNIKEAIEFYKKWKQEFIKSIFKPEDKFYKIPLAMGFYFFI